MDEASLRVLRWRFEGLLPRVAQALLIAVLLWLQTRQLLAFAWFGLAAGTALVDAHLSRRLVERFDDRRLAVINDISRTVSAAAFASVCFLILGDHSAFGLAASMLAACAINLNNAVMTAGVRRFIFSLTTPSSLVLISLPIVAWATGRSLSWTGALVLTVGAAAYVIFIVRLAGSLFREGQALRAALEAAEAASRAKSTFLAVTSHEIRTPLNGVLGMAQALENDSALAPTQLERIKVIRKSGEALLDLLNDILDLSKIEAGKLELETMAFDLEAVTRSAVAAFAATARNKGIGLELDFAPAAKGLFEGDPARLRQVLCNLISNAVKFTTHGGVTVTVDAGDPGLRISVQDTGPGVPAGFAERMFEKFTQADSSTTRRFGGTGLGLAISRELCEAMGGAIGVDNPPQGGALFVVELPLPRAAALPEPEPAAAPGVSLSGAPLRILAAEDNPINQIVLRTLLEQLGVESVVVESGAAAIDAWKEGGFDLILMDVQMPGMDGPEAARAIRAAEAAAGQPRTPIIALTANVMSHQLEDYSAAGMDAFVAKPIAVAELYAAIVRWSGSADAAETEERVA